MHKPLVSVPLLLGVFAAAAPAFAGEQDFELKPGPGRDRVVAQCSTCHSLDYIAMNSPFLDRKGWEASVAKMIKVMGAPVGEEDARAITDYLAAHYGK